MRRDEICNTEAIANINCCKTYCENKRENSERTRTHNKRTCVVHANNFGERFSLTLRFIQLHRNLDDDKVQEPKTTTSER